MELLANRDRPTVSILQVSNSGIGGSSALAVYW